MPRAHSPHIPLIAALAMIVALSLMAGATQFRHADDHHYTEAAIQMLQTGDWLTPRDGDGEARLIKPIVTYWLVAGSFELFGVSMFTARLPFILGAGLLVWFTGWLGRRLFNDEAGAWAALILAGNLPWLLAALRTIPDVWLCVFLTISCAGFLAAVMSPRGGSGPIWMGWLGLGLAVATKGMVGLLPLPAALIAGLFLGGRVAALFRPGPMIAGLGLGLAWFVAMARIHGVDFLMAFGQDQLNATFSAWRVFKQFVAYWLFLLLAFIPWSAGFLSLKPSDWRAPGVLWPNFGAVAVFTLVWTAMLVVIFSFAYQFSGGRYVLPAFPWIALLMGAILARARRDRRLGNGRFRLMLAIAFVLWLALLGLCAWLGLGTGLLDTSHVALVAACAGVVMWVAAGLTLDAKGSWKPAGISLSMVTLLPLIYWLVHPGLPDPARQIATAIEQRDAGAGRPVLMDDRGSLAGVVRVLIPERLRTSEALDRLPDMRGYSGVVLSADRLQAESYPGCRRDVVAFDYTRVHADELLQALARGRAPAFLKSRQQPYVLVSCRQ